MNSNLINILFIYPLLNSNMSTILTYRNVFATLSFSFLFFFVLKDEEDMIINQPAKADYSNNVPSLTLSCFFTVISTAKVISHSLKKERRKKSSFPCHYFIIFLGPGNVFPLFYNRIVRIEYVIF